MTRPRRPATVSTEITGTMLHKIGIPLARYLFDASLRYLKTHNPHTTRTLPVTARAPVLVLHSGASLEAGGLEHVKPWLPHLQVSGIEYLLVARTMDTYEAMLAAYPDAPVSLVKGSTDTDTLFRRFPSIRSILYVANTASNNQFLRYPDLAHVFLGHGDSDKSASMNRLFKVYDEVFVSGQAHIDRFRHADFDTTGMKFRIVGRPQVADLLADGDRAIDPARILYLPTWEGYHEDQAYSSLPFAAELLSVACASGLQVQAKLHPATGAFNKRYLDAERDIAAAMPEGAAAVTFVPRTTRLADALAADAIFVCDVSAAVSECLALDRPIFVHVPATGNVRILSGRMTYADYAYTFSSVAEFAAKLQRVLAGDDHLAAARHAAREYFISPRATGERVFQQALRSLAGLPDPTDAPPAPSPSLTEAVSP